MEALKLTGELKTHAAWKDSLGVYLRPGDAVDDAMHWYFLEVLPPAVWKADLIQIGEACSHLPDGRETFATLQKHAGAWIYTGDRPAGERVSLEA